jgi:hypothetical protein
MASSQPSLVSRPAIGAGANVHISEDLCPVCEQPIPHDRADAIAARLQSLEQEQAAAITARLEQKFAAETNTKVAAARDEARSLAQAEARAAVATAEQAKKEAEAQSAKAEGERISLQAQLDHAKQESEAVIARVKADAASREETVRAEARQAADQAAQEMIAAAVAKKTSAEEASAALEARLEESKRKHGETVDRMQQDAAFREAEIRRDSAAAAETAATEKIATAEHSKKEAESRAAAAQAQVATLQQTFEGRLSEQREAFEAAKTAAVNQEKAAQFQERLKLTAQVETMKRALEKKTADELGEGAHLNLLDALKSEFEVDRIERVNKGEAGADIIHRVFHNGKQCGTIIYDSKNHNAWRNDFVTKLKSDQMAAQAEYAVLSTSTFPAGERQLHVREGVIIVSPARAVALIQIIRQQLVQVHTLRMSAEQRTQKTAKLYEFITSSRCADLFSRFDSHAEALLSLQEKERKAHESVWRQQGTLFRSVQKVNSELLREIDSIIATQPDAEAAQ